MDDDEYEYEEYDEGDDGDVQDECEYDGPSPKSNGELSPSRPAGLKDLKVPDGGYSITDLADIVPYRDSLVYQVSSLLDLDRDSSQILLQHFKWRKEKLLDDFFTDKHDKVLLDCGLDLFSSDIVARLRELEQSLGTGEEKCEAGRSGGSSSSSSSSPRSRPRPECRICYDPEDRSDTVSLGCGHGFHHTCYRDYLISEVGSGKACTLAHCPEIKCTQRVPRTLFSCLLPPLEFSRYDFCVTRSFIEDSKTLRYCPSPGCDKVAIGSGISTIKCSCLHSFCFRCAEEPHEPVSCEQLSAWTLKNASESETANWILVNTKVCPACRARIEKNQGCNHMVCTMCKFDFCWICNGPWSEHGSDTGGFYKCNKYDAGKSADPNGNSPFSSVLCRYNTRRTLRF
jgi:ariadne-1